MSKFVSVQAMKTCKGSRCTAPTILNPKVDGGDKLDASAALCLRKWSPFSVE